MAQQQAPAGMFLPGGMPANAQAAPQQMSLSAQGMSPDLMQALMTAAQQNNGVVNAAALPPHILQQLMAHAQQQQGGGNPALQALGGASQQQMQQMQQMQQQQMMMGSPGRSIAGDNGVVINSAPQSQARPRLSSACPAPVKTKPKMTGWAEKQGGFIKNWKKRYFVLNSHELRYHADLKEPVPKGRVPVKAIKSVTPCQLPSATIGLQVETANRTYLMRFDKADIRDAWMAAIRQVVEEAASGVHTAASQKSNAGGAASPSHTQGASQALEESSESGEREREVLYSVAGQSIFLPKTVVGLDNKVHELLDGIVAPRSRGNITFLVGQPGSGRSTLIEWLFAAIRGQTTHHFTEDKPGFRGFAAAVCRSCSDIQFVPKEATALCCVRKGTGHVESKDGSAAFTEGEDCDVCRKGKRKLEWMHVADDEINLLKDMFLKFHGVDFKSGCLLRCPECNVVGVPMNPACGLCELKDGQLCSLDGQIMPEIDSPGWRMAIPHFHPRCQHVTLEVIPCSFRQEQVLTLQKVYQTAPWARSKTVIPGTAHIRPDMQYTTRYMFGVMAHMYLTLSALMSKAGMKSLENFLAMPKNSEAIRKALSDKMAQYHQSSGAQFLFLMSGLDQIDTMDGESITDLIPDKFPACAQAIIACDEEQYAKLSERAQTQNVDVKVIRLPSPDQEDAIEMLKAFVEEKGGQVSHDQASAIVNSAFSATAGGEKQESAIPLLMRMLAGLWIAYEGDLDRVLQTEMTSWRTPFHALMTSLSKAFGKDKVHWVLSILSSLTMPLSVDNMMPIFELLDDRTRVKVSHDEVDAIVQAMRTIVLTTKPNKRGAYMFVNSLVKDECFRSFAQEQAEHVNAAIVAHLEQDSRRSADGVGTCEVLRFLARCDRWLDLVRYMRNWKFIHDLCQATLLPQLMYALKLAEKHFQQLPADQKFQLDGRDDTAGQLAEEMAKMFDFVIANYKGLHSNMWSHVAMRFSSSVNADMQAVLAGNVTSDTSLRPQSKLVRIFTSSTFDDLKVERDMLMQEAYPEIRRQCRDLGLEFQVVDMRWGIRDESSDNHQTSAICMTEIRQCQEESLGPNFVTFLSQRYGYRPFPAIIEAKEFEALKTKVSSKDAIKLLDSWFELDKNCKPAAYKLHPVSKKLPDFLNTKNDQKRSTARAKWWDCFEKMSLALREAANTVFADDKDTRIKYTFSVTEEEIRRGVLQVPQAQRQRNCLWFKRDISNLDEAIKRKDKMASKFSDLIWGTNKVDPEAAELLTQLREQELPDALPEENVHQYTVSFAQNMGIDPENPEHAEYLSKLNSDFTTHLMNAVRDNLRTQQAGTSPVYDEALRHCLHAVKTASTFAGRPSELDSLERYLHPECSYSRPMLLYGPSGRGKTALAAKSFTAARKALGPKAVVAARFVGLTADSISSGSIVASLQQQICLALGISLDAAPSSHTALVRQFRQCLTKATKEHPIVLIIDGVDRISSENKGRDISTWLPLQLPAHVKIVVTVSTAAKDVMSAAIKFIYGQLGFGDYTLLLQPATSAHASQVLDRWLEVEHRTLQAEQRTKILEGFESTRDFLWLRIAFLISRSWSSKDSTVSVSPSLEGILNTFFDQLEKVHGKALVERACSYISLSYQGLSSSELEDILSLDDYVLNDVYQYWQPPTRRLPPLLWVRLQRDLDELIGKSSAAGVAVNVWAFRTVNAYVRHRYLGLKEFATNDKQMAHSVQELQADDNLRVDVMSLLETPTEEEATKEEKAIHSLLAEYFSGAWFDKEKPYKDKSNKTKTADRHVASQPNLFSRTRNAELLYLDANMRKLLELPRHLSRSGQLDSLKEFLLDEEVVNVMCCRGVGFGESSSVLNGLFVSYMEKCFDKHSDYAKSIQPRIEELIAKTGEGNDQHEALKRPLGMLQAVMSLFQYLDEPSGWIAEKHREMCVLHEGSDAMATASSDKEQAKAALARGDVTTALSLVDRALKTQILGFGTEENIHVVLTYQFRADIYKQLRQMNAMIQDLQRAINLCRSLAQADPEDEEVMTGLTSCINNLAEAFIMLGQFQQALTLLNEAKELFTRARGEDDDMVATVLNNMAVVYMNVGQFPMAEECMARCINTRQQVLGARHPLVGQAMGNLGSVYMQQSAMGGVNRYAEALPLLQRALEIAKVSEAVDKEEDVLIATGNLASCLKGLGQKSEAEHLMIQTVETARKSKFGTADDRLAQAIHNLAVFYMDDGQYQRAEPMLHEALQLRERFLGPSHPSTGQTCECIAICLQQTGRMQESVPWANRAIKIQQTVR